MNIAICDDSAEFAEELKRYVAFYFLDNHKKCKISVFTDGLKAAESKIAFDIVFLDVELGEYSGLDIGRKMKEHNNGIIFIVVTAYSKYLDDAFDMNVLRFLEKPIVPERLYNGLDKAIEMINKAFVDFCLFDKEHTHKSIPADDIIMVATEHRHTKVYTDYEIFVANHKLSDLQDLLKASYFVMPHASYIINMNKIVRFSRAEVVLGGKEEYAVSVASRRQSEFRRILTGYLENRH